MPREVAFTCHKCGKQYTCGRCPNCYKRRRGGGSGGQGGGRHGARFRIERVLACDVLPVNASACAPPPAPPVDEDVIDGVARSQSGVMVE